MFDATYDRGMVTDLRIVELCCMKGLEVDRT
jgi:hypothetical protein